LEIFYFRIYRNTPFWTATKSTVSELVEMGINSKNCTIIPCPISIPIPKKFIDKESNFTLLFVSRVVRMKGIEDVIKAFGFIVRENPKAILWIVGGGDDDYIQSLKQIIAGLALTENVIFFGRVSESKKIYLMGRAHLLLHASVKEGWGLVVLEAASQGTPSIVYKVPGLSEVVIHQKTGVVLDKNSPQNLAQEALIVYSDKKTYSRFQIFGKKWVVSLRWHDVIYQSEKLLLDTIKK
jgi:glycosyltransferase involved in cell wall biosynthesis